MRYTSDLTDAEWNLICFCFPKPSKIGRPRKHEIRELLNAIFYLNKTASQWRNLPIHFARWGTVYHYFRLWKRNGLWARIHTHLREQVRLVEGRRQGEVLAVRVGSSKAWFALAQQAREWTAGGGSSAPGVCFGNRRITVARTRGAPHNGRCARHFGGFRRAGARTPWTAWCTWAWT